MFMYEIILRDTCVNYLKNSFYCLQKMMFKYVMRGGGIKYQSVLFFFCIADGRNLHLEIPSSVVFSSFTSL